MSQHELFSIAASQIGTISVSDLIVFDGSLYGLGSAGALLKWDDVSSWTQVANSIPDVESATLVEFNSKLYGLFETGSPGSYFVNIYEYDTISGRSLVAQSTAPKGLPVVKMSTAEYGGNLIIGRSNGGVSSGDIIYSWDGTSGTVDVLLTDTTGIVFSMDGDLYNVGNYVLQKYDGSVFQDLFFGNHEAYATNPVYSSTYGRYFYIDQRQILYSFSNSPTDDRTYLMAHSDGGAASIYRGKSLVAMGRLIYAVDSENYLVAFGLPTKTRKRIITEGNRPGTITSMVGFNDKLYVSNSAGELYEANPADFAINSLYVYGSDPALDHVTTSRLPASASIIVDTYFWPYEYTWETYGMGVEDNSVNSLEIYNNPLGLDNAIVMKKGGKHPIKVTVTDGVRTATLTRPEYLWVPYAADFSLSPATDNLYAGDTVQFSDESLGSPLAWSWEVSGSEFSTNQNPTYTLINPGSITFTLTVSGRGMSDSHSVTPYVNRRVGYAVDKNIVQTGESIEFTSTEPATVTWDFGDESDAVTGNSVTHDYSAVGVYDIQITTAYSDNVLYTYVDTLRIYVYDAKFDSTVLSQSPLRVLLVDVTELPVAGSPPELQLLRRRWIFSDGTIIDSSGIGNEDNESVEHTFSTDQGSVDLELSWEIEQT